MTRSATLFVAALVLTLGTPALLAPTLSAKPRDSSSIARGRSVFLTRCAPCHGAGAGDDGAPHLPGTSALNARYKGSLPAALEQRKDLTYEVLHHFVRNGSGPMPMFRKTEVSDGDITALAAYLHDSASRTPSKHKP